MKTFSDEKIKAYFLGSLPVSESEVFEVEYAQSPVLTEHAQLIERELTDDFLRGNLTADEARLFENNYLVTEARRHRFQTAKSLWQAAHEQPVSDAAVAAGASQKSFWQTLFGGQRVFQLAAGGVLLLLVCGALAFYFSSARVDRDEVAEIKIAEPPVKVEKPVDPVGETENRDAKPEPANAAAQNDREIDRDSNANASPKNQIEQKPAETPKNSAQKTARLAVFTLVAGTLRDEGEQFISLVEETKNVRLQLKLPEDAGKYQIYRILLKPIEGETVFSSQNLKSLNFTVPAARLENRTYVVFLEGKNAENEFESVAEYSFRVRR